MPEFPKPFNPQAYQPLNVFFELQMGELKEIFIYPNTPVSMSYTMDGFACAGGSVEFTLFDEAAWEVEPYIWKARLPPDNYPQGKFQFGYNGNLDLASELIPFAIDQFTPVWRDNGFSINIQGTVYPQAHTSSYQFSGDVEATIKDWSEHHDKMPVKFIPALGLQHMRTIGEHDHESTSLRPKKVSKLDTESDWQFLHRICSYCKDQEGKTGYYPRISIENGKKILKIIRPNETEPVDYTFEVQHPESVVIDWSPHVDITPLSGQEEHANGKQFSTGYGLKLPLDKRKHSKPGKNKIADTFKADKLDTTTNSYPGKNPPDQDHYLIPEEMDDNVTKGAIRKRPKGTSDTFGGLNQTYSEFVSQHYSMIGIDAELTIVGDPRVEPGRLCRVNFYKPINYFNTGPQQELHYTSGIYWISEVKHEVSAGTFTSTLSLWKWPVSEEEPQQGKKH